MKTSEIRSTFLNYFENKGHRIVASSSLVPANDPSLLFTNSGMVQFKEVFLGNEVRDYCRAVTSQRCVRAGGKHNDLENVGYTARHHTFFEMLGNFSFGDYFKSEAIRFAWELLTGEFGLPEEKLWVTVFEDDDEARAIWIDEIGVPEDRVIRVGAEHNFWQMGDTGPCGPCSEIYYDHGPAVAGNPPGSDDEEGDRYVEIWNLVFMQFNRLADGTLTPLPQPSVDTGMGLERMAAVLQDVHSNYETDLFRDLIAAAAEVLGIEDSGDKALRVIADHIRSAAFLIVDGVLPSNEGRGYVLRRIIRRAIRHGYRAGQREPFMHRLVAPLVALMGEAFAELPAAEARVVEVLRRENTNFNATLEQGLRMLDEVVATLSGSEIPGDTVFKLYDTYGFPVDLTADVAREHNLSIDHAGFTAAMQAQQARARAASQFVSGDAVKLPGVEQTVFVGYQALAATAQVVALLVDGQPVDVMESGASGMVVLDQTPFYAESGGQVGDHGHLTWDRGAFEVADTRYLANKIIAHIGTLKQGQLQANGQVTAEVIAATRDGCAAHHSATHLVHAALKAVLGKHVEQKGSLVEAARLRFDFSHHEAVTREQLEAVEALVNRNIRANHEVAVTTMELEQAKAAGAEALFGEKYDATVRTIGMGQFSFELCGGTHVARTGDIGYFKIVDESGIAAGIRRIEAVAAAAAEKWVGGLERLVREVATTLKTSPEHINERLTGLLEARKQQQKQLRQLQAKPVDEADAERDIRQINGIRVLARRQDDADVEALRMAMDRWKRQLGSGIVFLAAANEGKATLIAGVSRDLSARYSAADLIKAVAPLVDGKGGGRAELAQGGGTRVEGIEAAVAAVSEWVKSV